MGGNQAYEYSVVQYGNGVEQIFEKNLRDDAERVAGAHGSDLPDHDIASSSGAVQRVVVLLVLYRVQDAHDMADPVEIGFADDACQHPVRIHDRDVVDIVDGEDIAHLIEVVGGLYDEQVARHDLCNGNSEGFHSGVYVYAIKRGHFKTFRLMKTTEALKCPLRPTGTPAFTGG